MNKQKAELTIRGHFADLRKKYAETRSKYVNTLVLGPYGGGKTQLYSTCPLPIKIDSFDSGGTNTDALQPLIDKGDIIVSCFEDDDWDRPHCYRAWEKEFMMWHRNGWFKKLGTYGIDSGTNWVVSLICHIMSVGKGKGVNPHPGVAPYQSDYLWQQLIAGNILRKYIMPLPCHFLMTGHLHATKDEMTGRIHSGLLMWGKIADQIPLLFDEKYIMAVTGNKHQLQTKNDGIFHAETRMGGTKFSKFMEPDIRSLLKLAGKAWEDKPRLDVEDVEEQVQHGFETRSGSTK